VPGPPATTARRSRSGCRAALNSQIALLYCSTIFRDRFSLNPMPMQWKNPAAGGQSHFADAMLLPFFITNENVGPSPRSDCRAVWDLKATSVLNSGFKCQTTTLQYIFQDLRPRDTSPSRGWPNAPFRWITVCPRCECSKVTLRPKIRDFSAARQPPRTERRSHNRSEQPRIRRPQHRNPGKLEERLSRCT
jgi:hypothetical protein